jgi:hypothetical protein
MIPSIDDSPWPGFPADLTSIITVVATQVEGTVLIHEKMFESRMFFVDKLIGMGARIILCDPHRAVISGPARLRGADLVSPDVRAGMAMVLAALCAEVKVSSRMSTRSSGGTRISPKGSSLSARGYGGRRTFEPVVRLSLKESPNRTRGLAVRDDPFVRFGYPDEGLVRRVSLSGREPRRDVRVELAGKFPVYGPYFVVRRILRHSQKPVVLRRARPCFRARFPQRLLRKSHRKTDLPEHAASPLREGILYTVKERTEECKPFLRRGVEGEIGR